MGFYGNITDMAHTPFQFDKIFENRRALDIACLAGTDGIFSGRFVLVTYDPDCRFFAGDILNGYYDLDTNIMYLNKDKTVEYKFTTFMQATNINAENWDQYYWKLQVSKNNRDYNYYYKLPSVEYFNENETDYYIATADGNANALITTNQFVRAVTSEDESIGVFYKCTGSNGSKVLWQKILSDDVPDYIKNYNIDKEFYGLDFDIRGYDATVWEKVYSEGKGKFILVAHLSGMMPRIDLVADAPSLLPQAPYLDATSSDGMYRIHTPVHWGFRIKEAEAKQDENNNVTYPLSDQNVNQHYFTYDADNQVISDVIRNIPADIYFNKNGTIRVKRYFDNDTANEILITPTGESGKVYFDNNGNRITIDTYELSIHLPIIGNLISNFYDTFYTENRNLDINWYNADSVEKITGNPLLNGKTRDLNSVAGSINTLHDRLGQIIQPLDALPSAQQILSMDESYIYSIYNENTDSTIYFRVGLKGQYEEIPEYSSVGHLSEETYSPYVFYTYDSTTGKYILAVYDYNNYNDTTEFFRKNIEYSDGEHLLEEEYQRYTYYVKKTDEAQELIEAIYPYTYYVNNNDFENENGDPVFYKKNITALKYTKIDLLPYEEDKYFYYNGRDYLLDHNVIMPTFPNVDYYLITEDNYLNSPMRFQASYNARTYFTKDGKNYKLAKEETPDVTTYYALEMQRIGNEQQIVYQSGKYYYYENGVLTPDVEGNTFNDQLIYFYIPYDTSKLITIYDVESGRTVIGYALDVEHQQVVNLFDPGSEDVYIMEDLDLIHISNVQDLNVAYTYYVITSETEMTSFFLPNVYYTYDSDGYHLAETYGNQYTDYYQLINIRALTKPFYEAGKYWWNNGNLFLPATTVQYDETQAPYYIETGIYVLRDTSGRYELGYEWKDQALFVPASVTLATKTDVKSMIQIDGINNGESSINGSILNINKTASFNNTDTRDIHTIQGGLNTLKDQLNILKNLYPNRMLYINDFGQITATSITYADLKNLFKRVSALENN